ncbi:MAG: DNA polymerase III subunit gamma/tau [Novosphingobium sp. 28-62-57]|uniref:DNA polymerase III subunit gamma/tau n=1 Tax=unclassified Novosphingobium TaxID=2644732 RepID=UPI000BDA678D|nr:MULTISPECIES: DNA polymerase III subunit gamma/tau [unclassified Novosphingobium]OYW50917.1 MAG: DNA polymerase III subunit gamma/tau [Novosphingobium sp. 12-62-10]OYZ09945.1 MAG: DNA polymerase III subunit gamma/tau [Novosphingobium sp. 28-62-57]
MADSPDMFGDPPHEEENTPSAAELEAAGQVSLFGDPAPVAPAAPAPQVEEAVQEAVPPQVVEAPAPPAPKASPAVPAPTVQPYRVLARKYRSQTFSELIGQDAMVQTLANAIRRDRLAHAFLMTGVRGVGKTSTARLIAKALNCIGPDGQGGPTIDPCGVCEPCRAIAEGRHIDVIEMDAASNRGIDTVRELTEAVRYATVSARYKIYIIDEVHMMTKEAFNALLKTLEEPPAHVKFLLATTEVNMMPVTVLSRCQRFDLKRIPAPLLASHFAMICGKEGVEAEDEALAMVAAAAEGSVRDGLSILDQAISHADLVGSEDGKTRVSAEQVRQMLGLADKTMQRRLLEAVLSGKGDVVLAQVAQQYALGIEPIAMMRAQMDVIHRVTVTQIGGVGPDVRSTEEREALEAWAKALTAGQLHRLWQLLLKGYEEVKTAPDPLVAAQMALLRVMHAADMPDPGGLVKKLEELASRPAIAASAGEGSGAGGPVAQSAAPVAAGADWEALVEQVEHVSPLVGSTMRLGVRVVELRQGLLRYQLVPGLPGDPVADIRRALNTVTGDVWTVEPGEGEAQPSLEEAKAAKAAAADAAMKQDPLVKAALEAFPGAVIVDESSSREHEKRPWSKRA